MKKLAILLFAVFLAINSLAQTSYDSITISRFLIQEKMYGANWRDTLKAGHFSSYLFDEARVWVNSDPSINGPELFKLLTKIKSNGTADVAKCFIPRHSINFYKGGKIVRYLLICFECDGLRFSDDPATTFIKNEVVREKQMKELADFFGPKYMLEKKIITQ